MGKRLYVGNLSEETSDSSLKQLFGDLGTVEMVRLMMDKGVSRGFGFIEMSSEREAANAINTLNGKEVDGKPIVVNEATPPGGRRNGSDRGGFGGGRPPMGGNRRPRF